MYCSFCSTFLGLLSTESFCTQCNFLRRLYLLHSTGDEREAFINKIRDMFLTKLEVNKEEKKETEQSIKNFIDKRKYFD